VAQAAKPLLVKMELSLNVALRVVEQEKFQTKKQRRKTMSKNDEEIKIEWFKTVADTAKHLLRQQKEERKRQEEEQKQKEQEDEESN
jgi:hypothetical protein